MNFSARFKNSIKSTLKSRSMCQCINEVDALIIQPCCSIFGAYVDMHSTYSDYSKPKEKRKPGAHVEMGRKKSCCMALRVLVMKFLIFILNIAHFSFVRYLRRYLQEARTRQANALDAIFCKMCL